MSRLGNEMKYLLKCLLFVFGTLLGSLGFATLILSGLGGSSYHMMFGLIMLFIGLYCMLKTL